MTLTPPNGELADEQSFRLVVEAAPNAIVMTDRAGKIVMINAQAERVFGYERAELAGQAVEVLVPERFRRQHPDWRKAFYADPRPRPMGAGRDLYALKKDGSEFPVEIGLNPVDTDEGTLVLSIIDISTRKLAEMALRESEQRYRLLVNGVTDYAIYMVDPNGIVTNWNQGAQRIKGYRTEDVIGKHFSCFYTEEECAANVPQESLKIAARLGRYEAEAAWRVRKDGSRFLANVVIDAIKDDSSKLVGFAKITRDITERVKVARELEEARIRLVESRAEEALHRVQAELAHVARVVTLSELTASIAHEVSQPIAATVANALAALRWLDMTPPDLKEVRDALASIVKSGQRAGDIIDHFRDLVKKVPPGADLLDINDAIREVIELTRAEAVKNNVSVRVEPVDGLPLVKGDKVQLQQVVINLIVNAIEAMSTVDGSARELLIRTARAGSDVLVEVRDSGPGLQTADPERIFESFHTTKSTGLGMGLSISRSIIQAHGGRLWASANMPCGAIFHFTVPVRRDDDSKS